MTGGQVGRDVRARPSRPPAPSSSRARGTTSSRPIAVRVTPEHARPAAGSCRAGWPPAGRAGPATRRRWPAARRGRSASNSTSWLRRLATAAFAEASGVRRSWLTAASSAVRIRSASASGRAVAASSASRSWRSATAAWAANASTIRRSAASSRRPRSTTVTGRRRPARRSSPPPGWCTAAVADAGHDPPGVPARGPVRAPGGAPAASSSSADRAQPEGLPQPVQQRGQRAFAAQHAARRRWPGSARRRRPGRPPGYAGRPRRRPRSPRRRPPTNTPRASRLSALGDGAACGAAG